MMALIVIIIGVLIAYCAEDNEGMQAYGVGMVVGVLGVVAGELVVGIVEWLLMFVQVFE